MSYDVQHLTCPAALVLSLTAASAAETIVPTTAGRAIEVSMDSSSCVPEPDAPPPEISLDFGPFAADLSYSHTCDYALGGSCTMSVVAAMDSSAIGPTGMTAEGSAGATWSLVDPLVDDCLSGEAHTLYSVDFELPSSCAVTLTGNIGVTSDCFAVIGVSFTFSQPWPGMFYINEYVCDNPPIGCSSTTTPIEFVTDSLEAGCYLLVANVFFMPGTNIACLSGSATGEFSFSLTLGEGECPWDLDGDLNVGTTDLLALLAAWGPNPGHPADFDGDGLVGTSDLLALIGAWGPCP